MQSSNGLTSPTAAAFLRRRGTSGAGYTAHTNKRRNSMKQSFEQCTTEEFDEILDGLAKRMGVSSILAIDGVRELVQEELNNEVLEEWARLNPEKAADWSEEETAINRLTREDMVEILEAEGIQCYDNEDKATLGTALLENVKDGTIEFSTITDR